LLNNCTSNTTMLQPQQYLSNSLCHKHHCWTGTGVLISP
jgi:hypothetical protein